jgi:hypothetical protein
MILRKRSHSRAESVLDQQVRLLAPKANKPRYLHDKKKTSAKSAHSHVFPHSVQVPESCNTLDLVRGVGLVHGPGLVHLLVPVRLDVSANHAGNDRRQELKAIGNND